MYLMALIKIVLVIRKTKYIRVFMYDSIQIIT